MLSGWLPWGPSWCTAAGKIIIIKKQRRANNALRRVLPVFSPPYIYRSHAMPRVVARRSPLNWMVVVTWRVLRSQVTRLCATNSLATAIVANIHARQPSAGTFLRGRRVVCKTRNQSGVLLYLPRVTAAIGEVKGGRHWGSTKSIALFNSLVKLKTILF